MEPTPGLGGPIPHQKRTCTELVHPGERWTVFDVARRDASLGAHVETIEIEPVTRAERFGLDAELTR